MFSNDFWLPFITKTLASKGLKIKILDKIRQGKSLSKSHLKAVKQEKLNINFFKLPLTK